MPLRRRKEPLVAAQIATADSSTPAPSHEPGGQPTTRVDTDLVGRTYWFLKNFKSGYGGTDARLVKSHDEGNLVSSECEDGLHAPIFDLDYDVDLIPSKTPGHFHLYLNKKIEWDKYLKVLEAMADAGLIEQNYYKAAKTRRKAMLTIPSGSGVFEDLVKKIRLTGTMFPDE